MTLAWSAPAASTLTTGIPPRLPAMSRRRLAAGSPPSSPRRSPAAPLRRRRDRAARLAAVGQGRRAVAGSRLSRLGFADQSFGSPSSSSVRYFGASAIALAINAPVAASSSAGGASVRCATGTPSSLKNSSWRCARFQTLAIRAESRSQPSLDSSCAFGAPSSAADPVRSSRRCCPPAVPRRAGAQGRGCPIRSRTRLPCRPSIGRC